MKRILAALTAILVSVGAAAAASVVNRDDQPRTLIVTEGSDQSDITVGPGETVEFCTGGCFVTMPNGDREVLTGAEMIEIIGGRGHIR